MSEYDPGIRHYVEVLQEGGVETCQSCQGGPGHAYLEPTVDFLGGQYAGPQAVAVALMRGLPVYELLRVWHVRDGEMDGPIWRLTFNCRSDEHQRQVAAREARWFKRKKTGRLP